MDPRTQNWSRAAVTAMVVAGLCACTAAPDATSTPDSRTRSAEDTTSPAIDGDRPDNHATTPTSSEPTTGPTTGPTTEPTTEPSDESIFERVIRGIFESTPNDTCADHITPGSTSSVITVERLAFTWICIDGLRRPTSPPPVQLTGPSGSTVDVPITPGIGWIIDPTVGPGVTSEPGTYAFRIVEPSPSPPPASDTTPPTSTPTGSPSGGPQQTAAPSPGASAVAPTTRVTSGRLIITASTERRVRMALSDRTVDVQLAGYAPGSRVRVAVYRPGVPGTADEAYYQVAAELAPVRADAQGEATASLLLPPSLAAGPYGLWTEPGPTSTRDCGSSTCLAFNLPGP